MPPIKCTPCRVTYNNQRYRVYADGSASPTLSVSDIGKLRLNVHEALIYEAQILPRYHPHSPEARIIRQEASRQRRNHNARERSQAMRDLGVKKTPYGWE